MFWDDDHKNSEDVTLRPESLKKAIDGHQASFTSLRSSLSQAKYEVFLDSRLRATVHSYDDAVKSMTRLAQGLTGLRSGCSLQYDLMRARSEGKLGLEKREKRQESEEMRQLLDEMVVLEQFRERVGASMSALTVRDFHSTCGKGLFLTPDFIQSGLAREHSPSFVLRSFTLEQDRQH